MHSTYNSFDSSVTIQTSFPKQRRALLKNSYRIDDKAAASTVLRLSPERGAVQIWSLGGDRTVAVDTLRDGSSVTMLLQSNSHKLSWWGPIRWPGGQPPPLSASGFCIVTLQKIGGTVYGFDGGAFLPQRHHSLQLGIDPNGELLEGGYPNRSALSVPDRDGLFHIIDSSPMTFECWLYLQKNPWGGVSIASKGTEWVLALLQDNTDGYNLKFKFFHQSLLPEQGGWRWLGSAGSNSIRACEWHHVALTKDADSRVNVFVDGCNWGDSVDVPFDSAVAPSTTPLEIGKFRDVSDRDFAGCVTDVRFVQGTCLYSSDFTVDNYGLRPANAVSLLIDSHNPRQDSGDRALPVTVPDHAQLSEELPYGQHCVEFRRSHRLHFDTSRAPLDIGSGAFTVDFWFRKIPGSTESALLSINPLSVQPRLPLLIAANGTKIRLRLRGSEDTLSIYQLSDQESNWRDGYWHHHAFVRTGEGVLSYYFDGRLGQRLDTAAAKQAVPAMNEWVFGAMRGRLANFRLEVGRALYTAEFAPKRDLIEKANGLLLFQTARILDGSSNRYPHSKKAFDTSIRVVSDSPSASNPLNRYTVSRPTS
ncbi:hypothetical protein OMCYN_01645 [cyanobiont of Ornithocercus magnificus]|nr:hypothetical protein OMCYN_01645 [cyanobiont of Ornithocercus magnificus]